MVVPDVTDPIGSIPLLDISSRGRDDEVLMSDAIAYAEEKLRVHVVYDEVKSANGRLKEVSKMLVEARSGKRVREELLSDMEMEFAIEERGKHPDMSATAMEKHLKMRLHGESTWQDARRAVTESVSVIDKLDADRSDLKRDVEIGMARMNELGGYLQFLAVTKQASIATQ